MNTKKNDKERRRLGKDYRGEGEEGGRIGGDEKVRESRK